MKIIKKLVFNLDAVIFEKRFTNVLRLNCKFELEKLKNINFLNLLKLNESCESFSFYN